MYTEQSICVDCGKPFTKRAVNQTRCRECGAKHKREYDKEMYYKRKAENKEIREMKRVKGAVYINGHPQICKCISKCFYGSKGHNDCSYCIETGQSRIGQGLYIKDGKCDAYTPKGRRKMKRTEPICYKPEDNTHIWLEV